MKENVEYRKTGIINIRSLRGMEWVLHQQDESVVAMFMNRLDISEITARIICNRKIQTVSDAKAFLSPMLRDIMPNPNKLLSIDQATERVIKALKNEEQITIFADYDVDGATSGSLMYKFFETIGKKVDVYIPNRFSEGYGPNNAAFDKIKYTGTSVIIIADCGSVAFEQLKHAKSIGLDVIVIDHHITDTILPEAVAILNPNRYDETFEPKAIAAVAVSFLFLVELRKQLREIGWFNDDISEPDMMQFLDIVALGTVCDLMPLIPLNRAFIRHGLKLISQGSNHGITALMNAAKIRCKIQRTYDLYECFRYNNR